MWSYPNLHGDDCVTTDGTGTRIGSMVMYDPFGDPIDLTTGLIGTLASNNRNVANTSTPASTDGWQGSHLKASQTAGDIAAVEMGDRQYIPELGRFLSVDPVPGGNINDYNYPNDPVDGADISGRAAIDGWVDPVSGRPIGDSILGTSSNGGVSLHTTRAGDAAAKSKVAPAQPIVVHPTPAAPGPGTWIPPIATVASVLIANAEEDPQGLAEAAGDAAETFGAGWAILWAGTAYLWPILAENAQKLFNQAGDFARDTNDNVQNDLDGFEERDSKWTVFYF